MELVDALFPDAPISVAARRTRTAWLARLLGSGPGTAVDPV
ncbi:hypothetical protein [Actinoplanes sp. NPDC049265]